jgi:hypothetical protein
MTKSKLFMKTKMKAETILVGYDFVSGPVQLTI